MNAETQHTDSAELTFIAGPPPLVRVVLKAGMNIEGEHIQALHDIFLARTDGPAIVLIDSRAIASMTKAARELAAGDHIAPYVRRLAVLIDGPVSSMINNFFIRVSRPRYPVRTFTDEQDALGWLRAASP